MPSPMDNIAYDCQRLYYKHRRSFWHILKVIACVCALACVLECVVFNFGAISSASYNTVNLSSRMDLKKGPDKEYRLTQYRHGMEFKNLNTKVHNIRLDFSPDQPAQELQIKIQFTDDAHHTYFDTTEYTVGVPIHKVATNFDPSEYININASGLVGDLKIEVVGTDVQYPIYLKGVYINAHCPFEFSFLRASIAAALIFFLYVFRPRSSIYRCDMRKHPRKSRVCIILAVLIELYLVTSFLLMGSNLVGVATANYNSGAWDHTSPIHTFEVGGDNAQQYAELARAFAHGKVHLEQEPPEWLKTMSDPYDKGARDELEKQTGEKYLFDVAYHNGHYYVYFGVVPVLLFYLPFYLLTGANFPTAIGVLISAWAFILGCSALMDRFARRHFKRVSLGLYLLLQMPLVFCSGILYLLKFPTFYSLPIMLALAFVVWGIYFWMKGRASSRACLWYSLGSLCMVLVLGSRPQLILLSCLAFPLFWRKFITNRHILTPQGRREFICLVWPYVIVIGLLCAYNYVRFGSPLNFGANYNLTVNDMTKRGLNVGRIAPAIFAYFFQTPYTVGVFPYLKPVIFETTYMGQTIKEVTFGGIFTCLPFLWVLPFAPRILRLRSAVRKTKTVWGIVLILIVSACLIAVLDAEVAGILQRYYADFSFMFLIAATLLVFIANEQVSPTSQAAQVGRSILMVLVSISLLYSVLLCFVPETGWYSDIYPWAYQRIVEMMQFWN